MRQIWAVAYSTFLEYFRKRILNILVIFAAIIILSSQLKPLHEKLAPAPGSEYKVVQDISLLTTSAFAVLICIFITCGLIPSELERRTIFTVLSKPISRATFVLGKYLGALLVVYANLGIMSLVTIGVLALTKFALTPPAIIAVVMMFFQIMILTAVVTCASTFLSTVFNFVFSVVIFVLGNLLDLLRHFVEHAESMALRIALWTLNTLLPHFQDFDLRVSVVEGRDIEASLILRCIGYAFLYVTIMLILAVYFFSEREV